MSLDGKIGAGSRYRGGGTRVRGALEASVSDSDINGGGGMGNQRVRES